MDQITCMLDPHLVSELRASGYVIVPRTPTPQQLAVGWEMLRRRKKPVQLLGPGPGLKEAYQAMLEVEEA